MAEACWRRSIASAISGAWATWVMRHSRTSMPAVWRTSRYGNGIVDAQDAVRDGRWAGTRAAGGGERVARPGRARRTAPG